jgi:hypothetical protein
MQNNFCHIVNEPFNRVKVKAGNPYSRGWISTVDLLAPAITFKLLLKLKKILFRFYKTNYLNEWSSVLCLALN